VTAQFADGREILDIVGFGIGADGEVLRNPPEENLHSVSRNADTLGFRNYTFPSSEPEAIRSSLKGFLQSFNESWT
jgi:hypothetical protein